jgi:hypothetical protein
LFEIAVALNCPIERVYRKNWSPAEYSFFISVTKPVTNTNRGAIKRNSNPVAANSTLPLKIHLNQNSIEPPDVKTTKATKKPVVKDELMCPEEKQAPFQLFPQYCSKHKECRRVS